MAFLGIGKKTPKKPAATADAAGDSTPVEFGEAVAPTVTAQKKGLFGRKSKAVPDKSAKAKVEKAKPVAAPKARNAGGELNIYTGVLAAAAVALLVGCALIALDNLAGVEGTAEEGNPIGTIPSR
ncbi:MAG: hypothetical protein FJ285_06620 [Planctomycetes bacterium]|nr:hypothetical protein [Planctomycetota bacterium]